ncbi:MAG TPA: TetR/AcrR family transcriptional regulator [Gemmatimonadaceae bacterium]|nr:TetR/AcrR family transcriptional regulator [Gemmatimonadaceae bacterium]
MTHSPFFRPPQQSRSQETLDRILDAAEQVLAEKSFGEATLAEIMERAGVTVGAFYRRYPDKDALLRHLDERFFGEMVSRCDMVCDPTRWQGVGARRFVEEFAVNAVDVYSTRRGLLRSLFLRARTDTVLQQSALHVNEHFVRKLRVVLLERRVEITHDDPERAIELGFMMTIGALRELVVFGEVWPAPPAPTAALAGEIARMYCGYLGIA